MVLPLSIDKTTHIRSAPSTVYSTTPHTSFPYFCPLALRYSAKVSLLASLPVRHHLLPKRSRNTAKRLQSSYNRSLMLSNSPFPRQHDLLPLPTRNCSGTKSKVSIQHRLDRGRPLFCMRFGHHRSAREKIQLRIWPAFDRHTLRSTQEARIYPTGCLDMR